MGGLFKSPPTPPPLPVYTPPVDTTATDTEKRRLASIKRKRSGRRGLIATSSRGLSAGQSTGLLGLSSVTSRQRSLLGE